jgi:predicted nucleic acid-binding protein
METKLVIDASVWVSWFSKSDVNYSASRRWMEQYLTAGGLLLAPTFLLVEVAAAISRRIGQPEVARETVKELFQVPAMRFISPTAALFWAEVEIAADLQLRAGDATYVALARQLNIPLVSWDREQLQKAASLIATYSPSDYPFQNVP